MHPATADTQRAQRTPSNGTKTKLRKCSSPSFFIVHKLGRSRILMCEMAFCSGKLQQKTKLMCLRPLIFIKKPPTNYCCKKFATVIEESVVTYPDCLFITISYLFLRKCYLLEYYRLQFISIESHRFCNHRLFLLRSITQFLHKFKRIVLSVHKLNELGEF